MGCNAQVDTGCSNDERPGRMVFLDAFAIDIYEVTVAAYRQCVEAGKCTAPNTGGSCNWNTSDRAQHPINCVDWSQANAYCRWAGKRLPTEAEWEKAARGTDRRVYPWGNAWDATKANVSTNGTVAVGSYPAGKSPYGALDMSGNVWEWTADWYADAYYHNGPVKNPKGPESGQVRSVRGGS
ncbi:MAG: SUMF1/EgtB/PvdO family nonheme iron enzyme [Deltaproteobacteria bacterium]|nr:SUMF1/EgtB/PvdO family nonheme iron enzyme [Deltaproteobacteria bacterium]